MADLRISELPAATLPLAGTEPVAVVQGGETRKVSAGDLASRYSPIPSVYISGTVMGFNSQTPEANRMLIVPFTPAQRMTVQNYNIRTHNTSGASDFALAVYSSGANGLPTGAPFYAGAAFTPSYNFVFVGYAGLSLILEPVRYWLAFVASASAGSYTEASNLNNQEFPRVVFMDVGFSDQDRLSTADRSVLFKNGVTPGAWPALTGQTSDFDGVDFAFRSPAFSFRVAA
jgi:hypothetical protein